MHWRKLVHFSGFMVLSVMVLLLYGFTAYHSWMVKKMGIVVAIFIIAGLVRGIILEGQQLWETDHQEQLLTLQQQVYLSASFLQSVY